MSQVLCVYKSLAKFQGIKKHWKDYTKELYKKDHDPDNHDGVIMSGH